jgi:hypothetical protein
MLIVTLNIWESLIYVPRDALCVIRKEQLRYTQTLYVFLIGQNFMNSRYGVVVVFKSYVRSIRDKLSQRKCGEELRE